MVKMYFLHEIFIARLPKVLTNLLYKSIFGESITRTCSHWN